MPSIAAERPTAGPLSAATRILGCVKNARARSMLSVESRVRYALRIDSFALASTERAALTSAPEEKKRPVPTMTVYVISSRVAMLRKRSARVW